VDVGFPVGNNRHHGRISPNNSPLHLAIQRQLRRPHKERLGQCDGPQGMVPPIPSVNRLLQFNDSQGESHRRKRGREQLKKRCVNTVAFMTGCFPVIAIGASFNWVTVWTCAASPGSIRWDSSDREKNRISANPSL